MVSNQKETESDGEKKKAHGSPTKDFFVRMITRDITLTDCIMDLVDNAIDGAFRVRNIGQENCKELEPYYVKLSVNETKLVMRDNCGGISLADAVDYAFHFGRKKDAPKDADHSIGLYGIGMKRAIFKIGRYAKIDSNHEKDSFSVTVDVDEWESNEVDWDFDIEAIERDEETGTTISISELNDPVKSAFADGSFVNSLIRTMGVAYAFVIEKGFKIFVNDREVPGYDYKLKESDEIKPGVMEYEDNGVSVRIIAGLMKELENEIPEDLMPEMTEIYGWYVVCNDRVVLAGDKTELSVWGHNNFQVWHPQYRGFAGFLFLWSDDPKKLPWTTTKKDVDVSDPLYLRAVLKMKELTEQFIKYTNKRKMDLEGAKKVEIKAASVSINRIEKRPELPMRFPSVASNVERKGVEHITISYSQPKRLVKEVATALGNSTMSAREVGQRTFNYFREMELGE